MKGFTIVELLVVTTIIAILSVIILINYPAAKQQLALQRAATKLAQDIRRVQEMAIASAECCGGIVPETGYGIFIDISGGGYTTTYKLYADTGGNEYFTGEPPDVIIEPPFIELEKGVYISDLPESSPNKVSITFRPPDPEVRIKWETAGSENNEVSIILCRKGTACGPTETKTITVNKAGLISVD